jgi:superoxide dismutase, Cu-Zn family
MRACALGVAVLLALVFGPVTASAQLVPPTASADLRSASGDEVAAATFAQASDEVRIAIAFRDRTSLVGTHAIHIHSVAQCTPPSFDSAGPILNPTSKQHGLLNPDGPMAGDLPNLVIGPAGVEVYNLSAALVSVGPGPGANSLLGGRGTSLIIFSQPDDNSTQPDGNAGQRIACGPIVAGLSTPPPASNAAATQASATSTFSSTSTSSTSTFTSSTDPLPTTLVVVVLGALLIAGGVMLRRTT